ncbi:MAG: tetratricopeptide repeat protein [Pseudomonadota bacterium]
MKFLERLANKPSSITIDYIPTQCAFCHSEKILRSEPSQLDKRREVRLRYFCRSCMIDMYVADAKADQTKPASAVKQTAQAQNKILRKRLKSASEKLAETRRALSIQNARRQKDKARIEVMEQLLQAHSADKSQLVALQAKLFEAAQEIKDKDAALAKANRLAQLGKSRQATSNLIQLPTPDPQRWTRMRDVDANMDIAKRIEQGLSLSKQNKPRQATPVTAAQKYSRAVRYMKGDGVTVNQRLAMSYFEQAAHSGHAKAQYNIGLCRARGTGCKKNLQESYQWLLKATEQGHEKARSLLPEIAAMNVQQKKMSIAETQG